MRDSMYLSCTGWLAIMSMTLRAEFTSASSAEQEMKNKRKNSICYIEEEVPSQYSFLYTSAISIKCDSRFRFYYTAEIKKIKLRMAEGEALRYIHRHYASISTYFCGFAYVNVYKDRWTSRGTNNGFECFKRKQMARQNHNSRFLFWYGLLQHLMMSNSNAIESKM